MKRIPILLLAVTLLLFAVGAAGTHSMASAQITQIVQQEDTVSVYYDLLSVDKEPIKGAANCDTTVRIGDVDQTVKDVRQFDESREGCCYLFLIDTSSGTYGGQIKLIQKTLSNWVKDMSVLDYVAILTFGSNVSPQTESFTNNKTDLLKKIEKIKLSGSQSILYQAVGEAVDFANRPGEHLPNKRVVVLFSDGVNLAPKTAADTQLSALDSIASGGLPFYIFGYENPAKKDDYDHLSDMAEISGGNLEKCKPTDLVSKGRALYERIQYSCVASVTLAPATPVYAELPLQISVSKDDTTVTASANVTLAPFDAAFEPEESPVPIPPDAEPAEQPSESAQDAAALPVAPDGSPEHPSDEMPGWVFAAIGGGVLLLAGVIVLLLLRARRNGGANATPNKPVNTPKSKPNQKPEQIHVAEGTNKTPIAIPAKPPQAVQPAVNPEKKVETPVPVISISKPGPAPSANDTHKLATPPDPDNTPATSGGKPSGSKQPAAGNAAGEAPTVLLHVPDTLRLQEEAQTMFLNTSAYTLHLTSCTDPSQEHAASIATTVSVGRIRYENQIVIDDPCVSKKHCTFHLANGTLRVLDADSLNKTQLLHGSSAILVGKKEPVIVENGDIIMLGKAQFVVTLSNNGVRQ